MKPAILILWLLLSGPILAETPTYQSGTLVDLQRYQTGGGALRAQGSFCLAIVSGDIGYLSQYWPNSRWSYAPVDLVVGDSMEVRIRGNDLFVRKEKHGEMKTKITRRQRVSANGKPVTCALPVATN